MKETEKLIAILTKFGPSKLPLFNHSEIKNNSLESQLYENIKAGKYASEEEAMLDLYEGEKDYHKYRMLKSRLKQKLYNHLYFTQDKSRPPFVAQKKCYDIMHQAKSLIILTEYRLAEPLYKKALNIAIQYEFTEIVIECLSNLNFIYSQIADSRNFYATLNRLKHFKRLKIEEDKAYEIYYTSKIELGKSIVHQKEYIKKMPALILVLEKLWEQFKSFNIFYNYYVLNNYYNELTGRYHQSIINIKNCNKLLKNGTVNSLRFNTSLNKFALVCSLLRAKSYEEGLRLAPQYLKDFDPYSRNWFIYIEQYFLLAMHTNKKKVCIKIIEAVDHNPYFERLKPKAQESWIIYKAFLSFFDENFNYSFKYNQFIDSVPMHSKDKHGHNITILILQFLYLLKKSDYEQLSSKEDTFRKYAATYLKDPYSKRSYYLFKLMLLMIRANFDFEKCNEKS